MSPICTPGLVFSFHSHQRPPSLYRNWNNWYTQICYTPQSQTDTDTHLPMSPIGIIVIPKHVILPTPTYLCLRCTPGLLSPPPSAVRPRPRDSRVIVRGTGKGICFQVVLWDQIWNKAVNKWLKWPKIHFNQYCSSPGTGGRKAYQESK